MAMAASMLSTPTPITTACSTAQRIKTTMGQSRRRRQQPPARRGGNLTESDPVNADSDRDALTDGAEMVGASGGATDPRRADTDSDGLDDHAEPSVFGTNPSLPDTDEDGLGDGLEVWLQTDPRSRQ